MNGSGETLLVRGPQTVIGYHGCLQKVAERIVAGEPFLPSLNGYDWLGAGAYFWEYAPFRAWNWSERRYGAEAAVLKATLTLGQSLNLLDTAHFEGLQQVYRLTVQELQANGLAIPKNTRSGKHYLDRAVVEAYCRDYAAVTGQPLQTVRGCFPEGEPVFEGSRILRETHVQIAVRDGTCISEVELVHFP